MKVICFHPALAPYRLGFFNLMSERIDFKLVLLQANVNVQKFDQGKLLMKLLPQYEYLDSGFCMFGRNIRFGYLKIIEREDPNIVIGYESSYTTLVLMLYRFIFRRKLKVWTMMDDSYDLIIRRKGFRRIIRNLVLKHIDLVIVPSKESIKAFGKCVPSVPVSRFAVMPIAQDTAFIRKHASSVYSNAQRWKKANIPSHWKTVLIFVGRLVPVKNLHWLISQIRYLNDDTGLVLVGDGEEAENLHKEVKSLGISNRVIFAGRLEGDELYARMAMADGLVLCSNSELYGAVVAEALQWGTPCVVSSNCGSSSLIENGKNGYVFKYNETESFRFAVQNLPNRSTDSILPVNMVEAVANLLRIGCY